MSAPTGDKLPTLPKSAESTDYPEFTDSTKPGESTDPTDYAESTVSSDPDWSAELAKLEEFAEHQREQALEQAGEEELDHALRQIRHSEITIDVALKSKQNFVSDLRRCESNLDKITERLEALSRKKIALEQARRTVVSHTQSLQNVKIELDNGLENDLFNTLQTVARCFIHSVDKKVQEIMIDVAEQVEQLNLAREEAAELKQQVAKSRDLLTTVLQQLDSTDVSKK